MVGKTSKTETRASGVFTARVECRPRESRVGLVCFPSKLRKEDWGLGFKTENLRQNQAYTSDKYREERGIREIALTLESLSRVIRELRACYDQRLDCQQKWDWPHARIWRRKLRRILIC